MSVSVCRKNTEIMIGVNFHLVVEDCSCCHGTHNDVTLIFFSEKWHGDVV